MTTFQPRLVGTRTPDTTTWALAAAFVAAGALSGLVVAVGKVTWIALVAGAALSVAMLNWPALAVWVVLLGALVVSGPLAFYVPSLAKVPWLFSLLGFFLVIASAVHGALRTPVGSRRVPSFVWLSIVFLLYALASLAWGQGTSDDWAMGIKRMFQASGLMLALSLIAFSPRSVRMWLGFVLVVAFAQVPLALYQRVFLVPVLPGRFDVIVGFLELTQRGTGSDGVFAYMQVLAFAVLLLLWREKIIGVGRLLIGSAVLLLPIAVGEFNVIFLWFPLAIMAAFFDVVRRRPGTFLAGSAAAIAAIVAFGAVYVIWQQKDDRGREVSAAQRIETIISYNFGNTGYMGTSDLNRTLVYPHWWKNHGLDQPVQWAFGHGVGATNNTLGGQSPLAVRFGGMSLGLVTASTLLWELGVVGLALFVGVLLLAWTRALRLSLQAPPGVPRLIARSLFVSCTLVISTIVYSSALVSTMSQEVLAALTLGGIAWLDRFGMKRFQREYEASRASRERKSRGGREPVRRPVVRPAWNGQREEPRLRPVAVAEGAQS